MGANDTRITRLTRAIGTVTSIFRCRGLQLVPASADRIGGHDILYWIGFLALLSGWYLFVYMPQCWRYERLVGRQQSLMLELDGEKKELARLHQGIESLQHGDAMAWERVARKRMGWLEPGEILDADKWLDSHSAVAGNSRGSTGSAGSVASPRTGPSPTPVLPRPRVPQIPRAQQSVPSGFTHIGTPSPKSGGSFADSAALGAIAAQPPPPPIPTLPQRHGISSVQAVNFPRQY